MLSNPSQFAQTESLAGAGEGTASAAADRPGDAAGRKNLLQLIHLRWIAVIGQIITIAVVRLGLGVHLPLPEMTVVVTLLIVFNLVSALRERQPAEVSNRELLLAVLMDVAGLTALLYLSGGTSNPFVFLYLLQVIIGAILLEKWATWTIVAISLLCFAGLAAGARPLGVPLDLEHGLASLYIQGVLVCFALNASLLVIFISRISTNLRMRDLRLADLRQRATEEEHIVRMGLLASGAAHELGTPLATVSVILSDWRRMPEFIGRPDLLQEIGEMQAQLQRCKTTVSGILLSAGEARGESSVKTTVQTFLDELVGEWRSTRGVSVLAYDNAFGEDLPVVSDSALKQMICNVLDNALEASPSGLRLDVRREHDTLVLIISDQGPGFQEAVLLNFAKPYQSTKGRPGGGLGLFLVVNVARNLGGSVVATNRPEGGASVRLVLPLSSIRLEPAVSDGH